MDRPRVRYAHSGNVNIAYQVIGDGPFDLVLVPGFISHLDLDWDEPRSAYFLRRLASFSRLIRFDKRGTGLSDRPGGLPDLERRMDDVRAVLDAVGSERAVLFGYSEGGPLSVLFAGTYPERTSALVLYGTYAKRRDPDDDYPWAPTRAERQAYASETERTWDSDADMSKMSPGADEAMSRWWAERARAAASPGAARDLILMNSEIDIRSLLPSIRVPTLVLHRRDDHDSRVEEGQYIAERIPGARFVELLGEDHLPWVDADQILDVAEEFLTGVPRAPEPDRVLATILFTDIVGSTERAGALGDRKWRAVLDGHDRLARDLIDRFRGRQVKTTGDGVLAVFDGPGRAIRCAGALRDGVRSLGLEIRAGLHCGELELRGDDVGGIAVHIGARVAAMAGAGQVLVSSTVKDLVAGSGISFSDCGEHELKGVPGTWRVFALEA
jgi:class 3 adenylate cyclase